MDSKIDQAAQAEVDRNDGVKKPPRKPRPSELKAKKAKTAKKKKQARKSKGKKAAKRAKAKKPVVERFGRLDMRLSKRDKDKITAIAKRKRWTITNVVLSGIAKLK